MLAPETRINNKNRTIMSQCLWHVLNKRIELCRDVRTSQHNSTIKNSSVYCTYQVYWRSISSSTQLQPGWPVLDAWLKNTNASVLLTSEWAVSGEWVSHSTITSYDGVMTSSFRLIIYPSAIHQSIHQSIHPSINQSINRYCSIRSDIRKIV
jgi:hypothetical protein